CAAAGSDQIAEPGTLVEPRIERPYGRQQHRRKVVLATLDLFDGGGTIKQRERFLAQWVAAAGERPDGAPPRERPRRGDGIEHGIMTGAAKRHPFVGGAGGLNVPREFQLTVARQPRLPTLQCLGKNRLLYLARRVPEDLRAKAHAQVDEAVAVE